MSKGIVLDTVTVELRGETSQMDAAFNKASAHMKEVGKQMESLGKDLMLKVTLPLVGLGTEIVKVFTEQEDAMAKVRAVLTATGSAAGITADHIENLSTQLQRQTTFFHTDIEAAAGTLLVFKKIQNQMGEGNDVFDRTLKISMSLAEVMGRDLQSAVLSLGRAFEDPEQGLIMLRRSGIVFSQDQIAMIKNLEDHNHLLEAQKMILEGLEGSLKNVAQAMAAAPVGQFKQTWNELKDAMIAAGQAVTPLVLSIAQVIREAAESFGKLSLETRQWIVAIGGIAAAIGPALFAIGKLITLMGELRTVSLPFGISGGMATALIIGIGAIAAAYLQMKENIEGANAAMADSTRHTDEMLGALSPEQAERTALALEHEISILTQRRDKEKEQLMHAQRAEMGRGGPPANPDAMDKVLTFGRKVLGADDHKSSADIQAQLAETEKALAAMERQEAIAIHIAANRKSIAAAPVELFPKDFLSAVKEFEHSIGMTSNAMDELVGKSFPSAKDQAAAYFKLIEAGVATHVNLDRGIDDLGGRSLRDLARSYLLASDAVRQQATEQAEWNRMIEMARGLTEKANEPLEQLKSNQQDLITLYLNFGITWQQFERGWEGAKKVYEDATGQTFKWEQAVKDSTQSALESLLDFSALGKSSFMTFVDSIIKDLDRLAAKFLATNFMKLILGFGQKAALSGGGGGGDTSGIASAWEALGISGHAAGGFIPAGGIGLVGEAGPELVSGGRHGLMVTPMQGGSAAPAAGGSVHMAITIQAVDSKSFSDLVEENPGAITGPIIRAMGRSQMLREALAR